MTRVEATPEAGALPNAALAVRDLEKSFGRAGSVTKALNGISFDVEAGEFVGIMGPSGSGKTTLLNCISTIDAPTGGKVYVAGQDITKLRGGALSKFRRERLGFIFQDANLVPTLTAQENIELALTIRRLPTAEVSSKTYAIAQRLGIEDELKKFPAEMSGGQRQRVAAARAVVGKPQLVLADEPTGALDSRNTTVMLETMASMNAELGATIMMVTHDPFAASWASRILFIKDGRLFNELRRGNQSRKEHYDRIMDVMAFLGGEV